MLLRFIFSSLILFPGAISFSTPAVSEKFNYTPREKIPIYANELDSVKTQLNFEYYFLKFCQPVHQDITNQEQSFGSKLLGQSAQATPYIVQMKENNQCQRLCRMDLNAQDIENFAWMIDHEYYANLVIDNLPARFEWKNDPNGQKMSRTGFPIGFQDRQSQYFINNHLTFKIEYAEAPHFDASRIVGFTVEPKSIAGVYLDKGYCDSYVQVSQNNIPTQKLEAGVPVFFSYDVEFIQTNEPFGPRWDPYKVLGNYEIHSFSAFNSFIIILMLTCVIYYSLRKALGLHQGLESRENIERSLKWKELSRDVFRPPSKPLLLTTLIGTGIQIGTMLVLTLILCCFGFLAESSRGSLLTTMLFLFTCMGIFSGYYSARLYKMFDGSEWIKCASWTAILYPSMNLLIFSLIKVVFLFGKSSSALTPSGMLAMIALWLGVSMPLVFLGSWIGYKKRTIQNPCKFSEIEQPIKSQPCWSGPITLCILVGLLPFGAVFIELVFIMMSIWRHAFYYLFGYLFISLLLVAVTSAAMSIVMTYIQLGQGNHKVWWNSFLGTGSVGLYIFGYSIFFYFTELEIVGFPSSILYFGYMLAISLFLSLFCGSIGFFASYWFTRKIYGTLKTYNQIELDEQKSPEFGYETFVEQSI